MCLAASRVSLRIDFFTLPHTKTVNYLDQAMLNSMDSLYRFRELGCPLNMRNSNLMVSKTLM